MLPLLRVLPFGSVLLTALIVMLAATPPRRPMLPDALAPARGPLIDAAEHPEWRQFHVQAAFKRADEIERLRALPDAPTRMPVVIVPQAPPEPPPAEETIAAVARAAVEPKKQDEVDAAATPVQVMPAQPPAEMTAPVLPAAAADTPPPRVPIAAPQRIAGLPAERDTADSDDITGALDSPATAATIPVEIGETSSIELVVVLPPERPMRLPSSRPKAGSRAKTPRRTTHPGKSKRPDAAKQQAQPATQFNLFQSPFGATGQ